MRTKDRVTLDDLVGQTEAVRLLRNTEYGWILIYGPMGCGKTSGALALAYERTGIWLSGDGPDSSWYRKDGKMATVIRQIGKFLAKEDIPTGSYTPMLAPVAIRIIDEAQDINQKKLLSPLKALDYQSRERFLIFCTTDPGKLDRAIIDRCTRVHLQPLGRDQAVVLVEKILGRPDADMAVKIHQAGITRPRAIIETVETVEKGLTLEAAIRNIKSL